MRIWLFCPQKEELHSFHILLQNLKIRHSPLSEATACVMAHLAAFIISLSSGCVCRLEKVQKRVTRPESQVENDRETIIKKKKKLQFSLERRQLREDGFRS